MTEPAAPRHPARPGARRAGGRRLLGTAVVTATVLTGAAACAPVADPSPAAATTRATSTTPTPSPTPSSAAAAQPVWPLTGVPVAAVADRPALAVKVENSLDARPQTGLTAADVVWEEVVEGGITRFCAVYHSTLPAQIGPVRSVRPMDPAIASPLHGLLAFSGGQPRYVAAVRSAGLQVLSQDAGARGYHRSSRPAPHNVYADPAVLLGQADAAHRAAPGAQFAFAAAGQQPTAAAAGSPAAALRLTMSGVSHPQWTWSAPDGRWLRSEASTPAVQSDGARLAVVNVVVLRVDVVVTDGVDPAGNRVPETVLSGSGAALVASAGRAVAATWSKGGVGDPLTLAAANGGPVRLAPGSTWVELVPNGSGAVATG